MSDLWFVTSGFICSIQHYLELFIIVKGLQDLFLSCIMYMILLEFQM